MNNFFPLSEVWNETIVSKDKPLVKRDYIFASELGKSDIDVWLAMNGTTQTNQPDARSRRKFDMGNITEGLVQSVFRRLGLVVELTPDEKRIFTELPNLCPVSGRFDLLINGTKTIEDLKQIKATTEIQLGKLIYDDPLTRHELEKTILMAEKYINQGKTISFFNQLGEVKSMSLMAFNGIEESNEPYESHALQLAYYTRYNKKYNNKNGSLLCVCKDDARIKEFYISGAKNDRYQKKLMESWKKKSEYYKSKKRPPLEPLIVTENGRFSMNFNVAYSSYLTLLYGFQHSEEYREAFSGKISSWNRVLKRIADDEKMTKGNLEYIEEMKKEGYDVDKLVYQLVQIKNNKEKGEIL